MNKNIIGNYLDRKVEILFKNKFLDLSKINMKNTVLLIYFNGFILKDLDLNIKQIINANPLGIAIAGKKKDIIFDLLLKKLSRIKTPYHIMTRIIREKNIEKVLEDFFVATWPAEESFDLWEKYSIIFIGNKFCFYLFRKKLKKFLKI